MSLKGILESHFHADFVSGHKELMEKTNATIYFGPTASARCKFPHHEVQDNEVANQNMISKIEVLNFSAKISNIFVMH